MPVVLIAAPKNKRTPGGVDLDGPVPRYAGCSLRKVAAARAASFVHAVGSSEGTSRARISLSFNLLTSREDADWETLADTSIAASAVLE